MICQTQPTKKTWCPLRHTRRTRTCLRGTCKREYVVNVDLCSCHDHFAHEALDDGLALFKGEKSQIFSQELPKGLGVLDNLAPMDGLLLCPGNLLPLLLDGRHLKPRMPLPHSRSNCATRGKAA